MYVDKQKLLDWIEMRMTDHKEKQALIQNREFSKPFDTREYDYHVGARSELVFLRKCVVEIKAFDIESTEILSEA